MTPINIGLHDKSNRPNITVEQADTLLEVLESASMGGMEMSRNGPYLTVHRRFDMSLLYDNLQRYFQ